jgi:hypothetical protein
MLPKCYEGLLRAIRRRREPVRPKPDPGEKGDEGDVLAGLGGERIARWPDDEAVNPAL